MSGCFGPRKVLGDRNRVRITLRFSTSRPHFNINILPTTHDGLTTTTSFFSLHDRGTEIKIIDMEELDLCWSLKGHKKAINCLSFDPLGNFLVRPHAIYGCTPLTLLGTSFTD
jgi:hypothetical protein